MNIVGDLKLKMKINLDLDPELRKSSLYLDLDPKINLNVKSAYPKICGSSI